MTKRYEISIYLSNYVLNSNLFSLSAFQVVKADGGAQSADALMPFAYLYIFEKVKPEAGQ